MNKNVIKTLAERFQDEKNDIALLRRKGLEWQEVFPLSIRQSLFPSMFTEKNDK